MWCHGSRGRTFLNLGVPQYETPPIAAGLPDVKSRGFRDNVGNSHEMSWHVTKCNLIRFDYITYCIVIMVKYASCMGFDIIIHYNWRIPFSFILGWSSHLERTPQHHRLFLPFDVFQFPFWSKICQSPEFSVAKSPRLPRTLSVLIGSENARCSS